MILTNKIRHFRLLRQSRLSQGRSGKTETTRGLLATDHVILNHGQVTWTTPEQAHPLLTTTPHQREDVSALDRFNVHRCPTRRVFSGTGLELVTRQATVRYRYYSATAAARQSKKGAHKEQTIQRYSYTSRLLSERDDRVFLFLPVTPQYYGF
ncbi:uncharacterized protein TNCV_4891991 [Trichonephila clavipes]|nr:uncharacterized protein TNCV_4891991 [Trichonephila clavipes]